MDDRSVVLKCQDLGVFSFTLRQTILTIEKLKHPKITFEAPLESIEIISLEKKRKKGFAVLSCLFSLIFIPAAYLTLQRGQPHATAVILGVFLCFFSYICYFSSIRRYEIKLSSLDPETPLHTLTVSLPLSPRKRKEAQAFLNEADRRRALIPKDCHNAVVAMFDPEDPLWSRVAFSPFFIIGAILLAGQMPKLLFVLLPGYLVFILFGLWNFFRLPKEIRKGARAWSKGNYEEALDAYAAFENLPTTDQGSTLTQGVHLLERLKYFENSLDMQTIHAPLLDPEQADYFKNRIQTLWQIEARKEQIALEPGEAHPGQNMLKKKAEALLRESGAIKTLEAKGFTGSNLRWAREQGYNTIHVIEAVPLAFTESGKPRLLLFGGIFIQALAEAVYPEQTEIPVSAQFCALSARIVIAESEDPKRYIVDDVFPFLDQFHSLNHLYPFLKEGDFATTETFLNAAVAAHLLEDFDHATALFGWFEQDAPPYWKKRAQKTAAFLAKKKTTCPTPPLPA